MGDLCKTDLEDAVLCSCSDLSGVGDLSDLPGVEGRSRWADLRGVGDLGASRYLFGVGDLSAWTIVQESFSKLGGGMSSKPLSTFGESITIASPSFDSTLILLPLLTLLLRLNGGIITLIGARPLIVAVLLTLLS